MFRAMKSLWKFASKYYADLIMIFMMIGILYMPREVFHADAPGFIFVLILTGGIMISNRFDRLRNEIEKSVTKRIYLLYSLSRGIVRILNINDALPDSNRMHYHELLALIGYKLNLASPEAFTYFYENMMPPDPLLKNPDMRRACEAAWDKAAKGLTFFDFEDYYKRMYDVAKPALSNNKMFKLYLEKTWDAAQGKGLS